MKIVIVHTGPSSEVIAASSVNLGIKKQPINTKITWVTSKENTYIFKYNKNVSKVLSCEEFLEDDSEYDLLINLWPFEIKSKSNIITKALKVTFYLNLLLIFKQILTIFVK